MPLKTICNSIYSIFAWHCSRVVFWTEFHQQFTQQILSVVAASVTSTAVPEVVMPMIAFYKFTIAGGKQPLFQHRIWKFVSQQFLHCGQADIIPISAQRNFLPLNFASPGAIAIEAKFRYTSCLFLTTYLGAWKAFPAAGKINPLWKISMR